MVRRYARPDERPVIFLCRRPWILIRVEIQKKSSLFPFRSSVNNMDLVSFACYASQIPLTRFYDTATFQECVRKSSS